MSTAHPAHRIEGRHVLVLGLGLTGLSMARWLHARGARVRVADTRDHPPSLDALRAQVPDAEVITGALAAGTFAGVDLLAVSPGVPLAQPEVAAALARGVPAVGDIELFGRALDAAPRRPVVLAITGSNGKSTVTEMTGAACRAGGRETLVAGNIGLPVLDALAEVEAGRRPAPEVVVLELSSFQLETTTSLRPDAATVLNLSEDHLDRYPDLEAYGRAKARIFAGARVALVNRDDARTVAMAQGGATTWSFGLGPATGRGQWGLERREGQPWITQEGQLVMPVSTLQVAGLHNAANAMAALALAHAAGVPRADAVRGLAGFRGLAHRVELVADTGGVRWFDDSKGTNVGATLAALSGMPAPVVLIAGGDGKGQDFAPLGPVAARHARAVVLIGRDREQLAAALDPHGVPLARAETLEEAVGLAARLARGGDAVLLSPACASFDMFRNYEHRAQVFRDAVAALGEGVAC